MRYVESGSRCTAHHNQRSRLDIDPGSGGSLPFVFGRPSITGVQNSAPTLSPSFRGERKLHRLPMSIEDYIEGVIEDAPSGCVEAWNFVTAYEHAQRLRERYAPVLVGHLFSIGAEPREIANIIAANRSSLKPSSPPEQWVLLVELDDLAGEFELLGIYIVPVQPRNLIVLAIGVVVAPLRPPEFVATEKHWDAQRQEKRRDKIALLTDPQHIYFGVFGRPFEAAIPRSIVSFAVAILFAIFFIVAFVVANQISQREAVMG